MNFFTNLSSICSFVNKVSLSFPFDFSFSFPESLPYFLISFQPTIDCKTQSTSDHGIKGARLFSPEAPLNKVRSILS